MDNKKLKIILKWTYRIITALILGAMGLCLVYFAFHAKHTLRREVTGSLISFCLGALTSYSAHKVAQISEKNKKENEGE